MAQSSSGVSCACLQMPDKVSALIQGFVRSKFFLTCTDVYKVQACGLRPRGSIPSGHRPTTVVSRTSHTCCSLHVLFEHV
eukprot:5166638-Prymnesium_polylepis.1